MSTGAIIAIIVVILVVAALLVGLSAVRRRRRLQDRFGPEYDRAVTEHGRRDAEAELAERERRVRQLDIRPLAPTARAQYASEWTGVQEQFVDAPQAAVTGAQTLVTAVMKDRGYPTEAFDQIVADLSVEHAATLDHYRAAHDISERAASGTASTEELRQAMIHYRALFTELLGQPGNSASHARAAADAQTPAAQTPAAQTPAAETANGRAGYEPDADDAADDPDAADSGAAVTGEPISGSTVSGNPVPSRPQER
jgi:Tfp pilus assembly protein PilX